MAMLVVLQRTRKEHAHEVAHLVVEAVRGGRRYRLVVFVDQDDRQLFRTGMDGLAEKPERQRQIHFVALFVHHAQQTISFRRKIHRLDGLGKLSDARSHQGVQKPYGLAKRLPLHVLERQEDHRVLALLLAIRLARRPYLLVMEQRLLVLVERADHLQHRRLAEAPRAGEQHHARFRIDEVLENQRLVHAIGIAREPCPVARSHRRRQKPSPAHRVASAHLPYASTCRFSHVLTCVMHRTPCSLPDFRPRNKRGAQRSIPFCF